LRNFQTLRYLSKAAQLRGLALGWVQNDANSEGINVLDLLLVA